MRGEIMSIYGIRMAIQTVEKELHELEYSITKEEIRNHGSNVFILTENKELMKQIDILKKKAEMFT